MANILNDLQRTARQEREEIAIEADREISFSLLWSMTDRFAGGLLDRDIAKGDRVAICLRSPIEILAAAYGTMRTGGVPILVPPAYGRSAIKEILAESGARALVVDDRRFLTIAAGLPDLRVAVTVDSDAVLGVDFEAFLANEGINADGARTGIDLISRHDDDPAVVFYVDERSAAARERGPGNGPGQRDSPVPPDDPIGIVYTHGALRAAATAGADVGVDGGVDAHLGCLPLFRSAGFAYGATATLLDGGEYRAVTAWAPREVRARLYGESIDRAYVTPSQYRTLRDADVDPDHEAVAVVDATPAAADAPADGATRLCGTPETGITHVRRPPDVEAGRLGTPLDGVETTLLNGAGAGELAIRSDATMERYYERPSLTDATIEQTAGAAWIRTGVSGRERNGRIHLRAPAPDQ